MSKKPTILITGAAGLMGCYLVREMRGAGYPVRGFDLRQGSEDCDWVVGDVTSGADVAKAMQGVDKVIHTAARANIWQGTGEEILQTNVMGTWQVFDAARLAGVRNVIFCSSDSTVGYTVREGAMVPPDYMPVDTDHPLRATDPYALSKVLGEDIARSFTHWGISTVALRTVFVAYPEMEGEIRARHADPANYKGTPAGGPSSAGGGAFYNYIDPRDLARAFKLALELICKPAVSGPISCPRGKRSHPNRRWTAPSACMAMRSRSAIRAFMRATPMRVSTTRKRRKRNWASFRNTACGI